MKPVLYTALYGSYHEDFQPAPFLGVPAFAFTDRERHAPGWQQIIQPLPGQMHPRLQAKLIKLLPHKLPALAGFDVSIWLDASWRIERPQVAFHLAELMGDAALAFFPHRWRTSIVPEAEATKQHAKYRDLPIDAQVNHYYANGFPDTGGLMECTCLVRRHHEPEAVAFDEAWWQENLQWTVCDQLSAPYVAWKLGTDFQWLPYTLDTQGWFRLAAWRADR